jgi:hypothetical protein
MDTHLSAEELRDYLARKMTPGDFATAGKHVHQCRPCYQQFLEQLETRFPIEIDLDELAGLRGWHPGDEELAAYLEGPMDELDSDCIGLHLQECVQCRETLQATLEYRAEYFWPHKNGRKKSAQEWTRYGLSFQQSPSRHMMAGIAAVVIVVALTLWVVLRPAPQSPTVAEAPPQEAPSKEPLPEHSPPNPPLSDNAPSIPPRVAASKPEKREIERQPHETETALIAKSLTMPPSVERLDRTPAVAIRGNRPSVESFSIISPFATLIVSDRPTFRWTPLSGAESYKVSLFDEALHLVVASDPISETEWESTHRLHAGTVYTWTVTAIKGGREIVAPAAPARAEFEVIGRSALAKLNRNVAGMTSSAARGIVYANAGLLDDAEREFDAYLADHPDDYRTKELLQTVRSWRRIRP